MTIYEGGKLGYSVYKKWKDKNIQPPYSGKNLGMAPTKCPGKNFKWKGTSSSKSGKGAWYNKSKKQSLHPDFDHIGDVQPHWDYHGPEDEAQLFLDGTWKSK